VLASIADVRRLVGMAQRQATAQRLAAALAEWFEGHLTYLDSSLAQWVIRRTHGGTPVVVRRKVADTSMSDRR
jgi:hemerythrin